MKKTLLAISLLILSLIVLSACKDDIKENETTEQETTTQEQITDELQSTELQTEKTPEALTSEITTAQLENEIGGSDDDYFGVKKYKYRYTYYRVPYQFIQLVGKEVYDEWYDKNFAGRLYEIEEMLMISFVKQFNISREDFDKANEENINVQLLVSEVIYPPFEYPEKLDEYSYDSEVREVYDADLIYTFDNEKINAYYARPPQLIIEDGTNALGETVTERTEQAE